MIYTKSYIQTLRDEYHDLTRHLSNVKLKIQEECRQQFEKIDTNGSGYITVDEYLSKFFHDSPDYESMRKILEDRMERYKEADSNRDGLISLDEIVEYQYTL